MTAGMLPAGLYRYCRTSIAVERLNQELKRRSKVIGVFLNEASVLRIMGSVLIGQNNCNQSGRKVFSQDTYAFLKKSDTISRLRYIVEEQQCLLVACGNPILMKAATLGGILVRCCRFYADGEELRNRLSRFSSFPQFQHWPADISQGHAGSLRSQWLHASLRIRIWKQALIPEENLHSNLDLNTEFHQRGQSGACFPWN